MSMKSTYGKQKNYTNSVRLQSAGIFIICVLLALISLFPLYILFINATLDEQQLAKGISFLPGSNIKMNMKLLTKMGFKPLLGFRNSFIIAAGATFMSVFVSCLTAYGLTVYEFKARDSAFTFILAIMMVPVQVSSVGFLRLMISWGLNDNFIPLIIPAAAAPQVVFFMRQYMKSSFPLDIVEAARIDGCGEFRTFLTIGMPMMKPAIAVQAIFAFIANWNNYYTPNMIILSKRETMGTIPIMVKALTTNQLQMNYGALYCGIAISILPLIVVYLILSKFIIGGVALGGVKE